MISMTDHWCRPILTPWLGYKSTDDWSIRITWIGKKQKSFFEQHFLLTPVEAVARLTSFYTKLNNVRRRNSPREETTFLKPQLLINLVSSLKGSKESNIIFWNWTKSERDRRQRLMATFRRLHDSPNFDTFWIRML